MKFSKRTDWFISPNSLTKTLAAKRKKGRRILDLTQSNPTQSSFKYLHSGLLKPLSLPEVLKYEPHPQGLLEARIAVCRYYADKKIRIQPEEVFLTASTSEAYSFVWRLLADSGDTVLAPRPSYPLFDYLSDLHDTSLGHYPLIYDTRWRMDMEALEKALQGRPKFLILVNPNNPTGNYVHSDERRTLNTLCRSNDTALLSDEVFFDFNFEKRKSGWRSFAGNKEALTFTLSGISKILGLPQMKLSWIAVSGPSNLKRAAIERLEIIADTYLSVSTPSQRALPAWLRLRHGIRREVLRRLAANRALLRERLKTVPSIKVLENEGGWYAILKVESKLSDEALAIRLLEKQDLLVHPGYFFDFPEGNFLVLSLIPRPKVFGQGVGRLIHELRDRRVGGAVN